jgi:hypothetical protein
VEEDEILHGDMEYDLNNLSSIAYSTLEDLNQEFSSWDDCEC